MRLLHTFNNEKDALAFSSFLIQEEIENKFDVSTSTDWGSPEYGNVTCRIWIVDEDAVKAAHEWLELFLQNPNDARFIHLKPKPPMQTPPLFLKEKIQQIQEKTNAFTPAPPPQQSKLQSTGLMTLYLIIACSLLYFITLITSRPYESPPPNLPYPPLFSSPLKKSFLYDYPHAYEIIDKLIHAYGFDQLLNPGSLPPEGKYLLQQYYQTPYWHGIYDKIVSYLQKPSIPITFHAPMFEKIRQGELWRLITPCVLHSDLFHLFFNMIWLLVIGKQIEKKLGIFRYIIFILLTGIFSNTAQYLMSGSNFIGFSGVLCAMITFVWFRQKKAPWEGYQLLPATMAFITIFVLAMLGIQMASFFLEISGKPSIASGIGNTAHLSGGLAGIFLAQLNLFSRQSKT